MQERGAISLAAIIGLAAIGGFWVARLAKSRSGFKIVEQRFLPIQPLQSDSDAAVTFRLQMPDAVADAVENGRRIEFALVDQSKNSYPLYPMANPAWLDAVKLPIGYAKSIISPRIQVKADGHVLAETRAQPIPAPIRVALESSPDPRVSATYRPPRVPTDTQGVLELRVRGGMPRDERWRVTALRTPNHPRLDAVAELPGMFGRTNIQRILLPFAQNAGCLETRTERFKVVKIRERFRLDGLEIVKRFGGTGIRVREPQEVRTPSGAVVRLNAQYVGPVRPVRRGDARVGMANLSVKTPESWRDDQDPSTRFRSDRGPYLRLVSPDPAALGLRELRIGGALRRASEGGSSIVRTGRFSVEIELIREKLVPLQSFKSTIPIEVGEPLNTPVQGFGGPSQMFAPFPTRSMIGSGL